MASSADDRTDDSELANLETDEDSDTENKVEFIRQFSQSKRDKQVVIITAGKSGVGKSTLINTFLGLEGDEASPARIQPKSVTGSISTYDKVMNDVSVRVIDIPGLHAYDHEQGKEKTVLVELNKLTEGQADVLFYCFNITTRLDRIDFDNISTLTRVFGSGIWDHAIFVFTWADIVIHNGSNLEEVVDDYAKSLQAELVGNRKFKTEIRSIYSFDTDMLSDDSEINTYNGIVTIPVSKDPTVPKEWRTTLLLQIIRKCRAENIAAFLQIQYKIDWKEVGKTVLITAAGGGAGAVIGTGIGAAIGAAVGGALTAPIGGIGAIPTAAGGAALGAWIGTIAGGGGVGAASGITNVAFVIKRRIKAEREARRKIRNMIKRDKKVAKSKTTHASDKA